MAKKALFNFTTGDVVIEAGKVYRDEDVVDFDVTNFEEVDEEITGELKGGVVGEEPTITPELDTETVEEEKKIEDSNQGEVVAGDSEIVDENTEEIADEVTE